MREDRSIDFSEGGDQVAFQHGDDGLFVSAREGGALERIFAPADGTIAASTPRFSPVDERIIFAVARSAGADEDDHGTASAGSWDGKPTGRTYFSHPIRYTCLLRPAPDGDESPAPAELFQAAADHAGYVAADLAVRWHPSGERILFIDRTGPGRHSLFEFDLATGERRRIFPHSADALVFDFTPGGTRLWCALASERADPQVDGIWTAAVNGSDWRRTPLPRPLPCPHSGDLLARLKAGRLAWTNDDGRFAFVAYDGDESSPEEKAKDGRHTIYVGRAGADGVTEIFTSAHRLRDLSWHPGGERLGFVEEGETPALRIVDLSGAMASPPDASGVRNFVGWNNDGTRLAWTLPEPPEFMGRNWAFLFPRVRGARDRVYISDVNGGESRLAHSGMRITFPRWSQSDDALSMWATFTWTRPNWFLAVLGGLLGPGDPAAILDGKTGELQWLPVDAREEAQVGHYYLLKQDYEQAWRWYEKSAHLSPPPEPMKVTADGRTTQAREDGRNSWFFEYFCLARLGRDEEAAAKLRLFRRWMSMEVHADDPLKRMKLQRHVDFFTPLLQNFYIAEVLLSLDATDDGRQFFERELAAADDDADRYAIALCLSQMLLVENDRAAYVDLATDVLASTLMRLHEAAGKPPTLADADPLAAQRFIEYLMKTVAGGMALLQKMMSSEFLSDFDPDERRSLQARWERLRRAAGDNDERAAADMMLRALYLASGEDVKRREVEARLTAAPRSEGFPVDDPLEIERLIDELQSDAR